jgi:hypothetical protein
VSVDPYLLKPGSAEARKRGCICDPDQHRTTEDGEPIYHVEKACPVHGLGELKARLEGDDGLRLPRTSSPH